MALLTTGNFYSLTFYPPTNAAYAALAPLVPSAPGGSSLAEALNKAAPDPVVIYVVDSGSGTFAYLGGQTTYFDGTLIDGSASMLTSYTMTADDSTSTIWADDGAGELYQYDTAAGVLRKVSGAALGGFQAFIAAI